MEYKSGNTTIATGTTDFPILETLFGANWQSSLDGRGQNFLVRFNKDISFKLYSTANDVIRSLNTAGVQCEMQFQDLFDPENAAWPINEIYITNASGATCDVDVLIMPNRLK